MSTRQRGTPILPFVIEAAKSPMDLTAHAGLTLVLETMLALGLDEVVEDRLVLKERRRGATAFECVSAQVLMLAAGGESVEDIRVLSRDEGLCRLLGRALPSPDALHRFLQRFHNEGEMKKRPEKGAWIVPETKALVQLHEVNAELVRRVGGRKEHQTATLDLDATIIESHKREALAHYKGGRGYQPTAVVWAEENLAVADEYRDGNVPAAMRTLKVAERAFDTLPEGIQELRFRADSACHDVKLLKWLVEKKVVFSVSARMSTELREACVRAADWELYEDRPHERVEVADVEFSSGDWPRSAAPLRHIALRFSPKQTSLFTEERSVKYLAVMTNRSLPKSELIEWHWQKAGTIEHVHDVTKNDLGGRLPPSALFGANAAFYRMNLITFNVLTALKKLALPERFVNARPKRLRYEVFALPADIREHARETTARLGAPQTTVEEIILARSRLSEFRASRSLSLLRLDFGAFPAPHPLAMSAFCCKTHDAPCQRPLWGGRRGR